jgi:hypothetical protein
MPSNLLTSHTVTPTLPVRRTRGDGFQVKVEKKNQTGQQQERETILEGVGVD